jgi:hypothetical protein
MSLCVVFLFSVAVIGQGHGRQYTSPKGRPQAPNPGVAVVTSAAKGTWAVTKFTTNMIAKPVAKTILLRATPAISKFVLKNAAREALPLIVKLSVL